MRLNLSKIKFSLKKEKKKKSGRLTGLPEGIDLSGLILRKWFAKCLILHVTEKLLKLDKLQAFESVSL